MEHAMVTERSQSNARSRTRKATVSIRQLAGEILLTIEGWRTGPDFGASWTTSASVENSTAR
jgi:hypothetical protein